MLKIEMDVPVKGEWGEREMDFLVNNYPDRGKLWCMDQLKRSEASIRWMASKLKLRQNMASPFFRDWQERAAAAKVGRKRPGHSAFMTDLVRQRKDLIFSVGREKTVAEREAISIRAKERIKRNGHPRGMLGKHHDTKTRLALGERAKAMWEDPEHKVNSDAHRQFLSDRTMGLHQQGFLNHGYSRGKMGYYSINGKKIFFRSLWEANYALYLDFLIKQKQVKSWQFEVDTFWFEKIRRGVRSYKPDFKVITPSGKVEYHEVKGWMDPKSKTKIKRMAKYHPEVKLIVIDQYSYRDIKKKLGKAVGFFA